METTRVTLLTQAGGGSQRAWNDVVRLYEPFIYGWLLRHEVCHHDAEELTQDVLTALVSQLPDFRHSGQKGAFRHWLRHVTLNRARGFWRSAKRRPTATGESRLLELFEQLSDDDSSLSKRWDQECDQHILHECLRRVESEFAVTTLAAFRRQTFDGIAAEEVAGELGITVGAAYSAKSRVLRRLRQLAADLVGDTRFF